MAVQSHAGHAQKTDTQGDAQDGQHLSLVRLSTLCGIKHTLRSLNSLALSLPPSFFVSFWFYCENDIYISIRCILVSASQDLNPEPVGPDVKPHKTVLKLT